MTRRRPRSTVPNVVRVCRVRLDTVAWPIGFLGMDLYGSMRTMDVSQVLYRHGVVAFATSTTRMP